MIHDEHPQFTWEYQSHTMKHYSTDWSWMLGIIAVTSAGIAAYTRNFLFMIVILLSGIVIAFYTKKQPYPISISISKQGISINKQFLLYKQIKGFWLYRTDGGEAKMLLDTKNSILPEFSIYLPESMDYESLHEYLLKYIPEVEMTEPFSEQLTEKIGL